MLAMSDSEESSFKRVADTEIGTLYCYRTSYLLLLHVNICMYDLCRN